MTVLLVVVGVALTGAAGSLLRHEVLVRSDPGSPERARAVAVVNLVGALLVAVVLAVPLHGSVQVVLALGFCGSLTTFSTWMVEAVLARESGRSVAAIAVVDLVAQLVVGVGLVALVVALS